MEKNKSYAELKNKEFNWFEFLNKERYTNNQLFKAYRKSGTWVTCAVGNQCAAIPRNSLGAPIDVALTLLGVEFCFNIRHMRRTYGKDDFESHRKRAINTIEQIEERSFILLTEIAKQTSGV